ncbi:hypothetical protein EDD52_110152 [Primorskyibacter sedentarius]|uniref:4Fe-4S ferredoxin-type domain-containing protein n=1 Tax=Primorskyibacter sedentarius TaxID=745311 RepID=A0A4R3J924_9RHOB|nr:ferredoxin [Primorskyibacter sedentarius]TCS61977.1 hypothetical protein EDD52_110152 [Primorskyibacter sedentarius]
MSTARRSPLTEFHRIDSLAHRYALAVTGAFHPGKDDGAPADCRTLLLLGPDEPRFWPVFRKAPEYLDGSPDPLDRWSTRQAGALATKIGGTAIFPSDGPPWPPFIAWALATQSCHISPVGLLVHDKAGLFLSFRAAIALPVQLELPAPAPSPCTSCPAPCATACPVGALSPGQDYDVAACMAHVCSAKGRECRQGCLVRCICPVSQQFGRDPGQSAFHMTAFLKGQTCA